MGAEHIKLYGDEYLVLREPLFLASSVADDCLLLCPESTATALTHWERLAQAIGLGKSSSLPVRDFSTGERALAFLLLIAAVVQTKAIECKVLCLGPERALSKSKRKTLEGLWKGLPFPPSVHVLNAEGRPQPWL